MCSIRKFFTSVSASTTMIFALSLPVIIMSTGLAVDLAVAYNVKTRLGNAIDKTALAAATLRGNDDEIREGATQFFNKNFESEQFGEALNLEIDIGNQTIAVSAGAQVRANFMSLFGREYIRVDYSAEVMKAIWNDIEISLVLDLSGSMSGSRIAALRDSAKVLVDMIVPDVPRGDRYAKIAIAPYSMGVNVGAYANAVRGTISSGTCTSPGCQYYRFTNASGGTKTHQISTCVSERIGAHAYTDAPPSTAFVGRNYASSLNPCLPNTILPLSENKAQLNAHIEAFVATGSTAAHVGMAWGWYLLAPNFGYLWPEASRPADYDAEHLHKIVILMTDGEFNSPYCNGVISRDATSGSGGAAERINCNAHNGSSYAQAARLCTEIKDKGITVYTIGFDIGAFPAAINVMRDCATAPSYFYEAADTDDLRQAFRDIAREISSVYLSR